MNTDTRQTIHMGINFIFSPMPIIDSQSVIRFQQTLIEHGIEFSEVQTKEREITVSRGDAQPLQIKVAAIGAPGLGQLLITGPHPYRELELFEKEADAIVKAFDSTWPATQRQVIRSDATIRDLYETSAEHAFIEIWEMRLKQPQTSLSLLGRPVLGGGLRFVMPAESDKPESAQIEVKIESFLQDTSKLFVETQFTWPAPLAPNVPIDPQSRLKEVNQYIEDHVEAFMIGGA
jgi:hypothetical protein